MPTIIMRKGYLLILKIFGSVKISRAVCRDYTAGYMWGTLGYVYNQSMFQRRCRRLGSIIKSKNTIKR